MTIKFFNDKFNSIKVLSLACTGIFFSIVNDVIIFFIFFNFPLSDYILQKTEHI